MIFQDPYTSLNPRHTVGSIVGAPLRDPQASCPKDKVLDRVQELLEIVGLNPEHYNRYPHEFSGGQRQRIGIARALDAPAQAAGRRRAGLGARRLDPGAGGQPAAGPAAEFDIAFLFIAHDLAVVRHFCPEVAVMYLGKIVEIGDRETLYKHPQPPLHPGAARPPCPTSKQAAIGGRRERIRLEGDVPSPINPPSGCRFRTRCPIAQEICAKVEPPLLQIGTRHKVACHFAGRAGQLTRPSR